MSGPFGVDLPDNFDTPTGADSAPSGTEAPEGSSPESSSSKAPGTGDGAGGKPAELTDIDKLERFRFEGREWTAKELRDARLRQDDYTRKTQEIAETRKYVDNFGADLDRVIANRKLLAQMERVYPKEFVERAKAILAKIPEGQSQPQESTQPKQADPELEEAKAEIKQWREERRTAEIEQIQTWLDTTHETLSKKYPLAEKEIVEARAEAAARLHKTVIDEKTLEKLYKQNHGEISSRFEAHYKGKVTKQLEAGKEARDMGAGGGTPSGAPQSPRTIKEATRAALADIESSRGR